MLTTYPMNDVEYGAEDAELFHCTRSSGIFDSGDFACSATGADNRVTVEPGITWIRNSRFSGQVAALKAAETVELGNADSTYPRIDAVVLRFEVNVGTSVAVKNGTAAATPLPPEVIQSEAVYELHLCHVRREAGAASIPVGALTDVRGDRKYCGRMQDDVTPASSVANGICVDGVDMNTVKTPGKYYGSTMVGAGESGRSVFDVEVYDEDWLTQTQKRIADDGTVRLYVRSFYSSTAWSPWQPVLTNILPDSMLSAVEPETGVKNQLHFVEVE